MEYNFELIDFFMRSFGRRNFHETSSCIAETFIFQTPIIELEGRDKFIKLQKKIDSNFSLNVTNIKESSVPNVYDLEYIYHIHLHSRQKVDISARAKIYINNQLITKMTVEFEDKERAEAIFRQMIYH
ncbi:MAG: hypothetical protein COC24_011990 [Alphaproteobacteria bacterium]|nr:hypothetical protein [Alphaproteobacteria bacterium]